jgi:hypothetical protein
MLELFLTEGTLIKLIFFSIDTRVLFDWILFKITLEIFLESNYLKVALAFSDCFGFYFYKLIFKLLIETLIFLIKLSLITV